MTTARGIIKSAMRKAGILTKGEDPSADEASDALEMLNDLLASWSNDSLVVYARTLETFNLTSGTVAYTIGSGGTFNTVRPIKIISAYVRSGGIDYPISVVTEENYDSVSLKTVGAIPEFLTFSNGFPLATLTFYPAPSTGYQLFLRTEKQLSSFTLNQTVDLPPGWKRALIHNLAIELAPEYGQQVPQEVVMIARESKGEIRQAVMTAKPMQWDSGLGNEGNIYSGWSY
jgi:hypothetical protein